MNSVGAIIVCGFAVIWVIAGTRGFDRRWFAFLLAVAVAISAAIVVASMHRTVAGPATAIISLRAGLSRFQCAM